MDSIQIGSNGDAEIERSLVIKPSSLTTLYTEYWEAYNGGTGVVEDFLQDLQKQYLILTGNMIKDTSVDFGLMPGITWYEMKVTGKVPGAAQYDANEKVWTVSVKPSTSALAEALGVDLRELAVDEQVSSLIYMSLFTENLTGEQKWDVSCYYQFELPQAANITNRAELEGRQWEVDFGGGTTLTGNLTVEDGLVTLSEELVQTESDPDKLTGEGTMESVLKAVAEYGVFTIKYRLPVPTPVPVPGPGQNATLSIMQVTGPVPRADFSKDWKWHWSYPVSRTFTFDDGSSLTASATPSLDFRAYLGWSISWWKLQEFWAYITVNPAISASATATMTKSYQWDDSYTFTGYTNDFSFWVGVVPVWIRFSVTPEAKASVDAEAKATFSASSSFEINGTLGLRWKRNDGWTTEKSWTKTAELVDFDVTLKGSATAQAGPKLTLAAYVYNVAGPYAYLYAYVKGNVDVVESSCTWDLKAGLQVGGGVKLAGWLQKLLKLNTRSADSIPPWEVTITSGSC
jgi:hypothetical protein